MPKIALFDLESTLVENEFLVDLATLNGSYAKVAEITNDAMGGKIDFDSAFRERICLLKGICKEEVDKVKHSVKLREGASSLVNTLKGMGFEVAIVTNGFSFFADVVAKELGIGIVHANELVFDEQGKISGGINKVVKSAVAKEYSEKNYAIIAFGDGANDLGMFEKASVSFAIGDREDIAAKADFKLTNFSDAEMMLSKPFYLASKDVLMPPVEGNLLRFSSEEELERKIALADILILRTQKLDADAISKAQNLKLIIRQGVGLDGIDVEFAKSKGIEVVNTPLSTPSVAELAVGMMIMASRNLVYADASMKEGRWAKQELLGKELFRKNLGIIGLGRIGRQVARVCRELGMRILYYDPYVEETIYKKRLHLEELLSEADILTLHCPLTSETKHMLNMDNIKLLKKGCILVNTARGKIIEPEALEYALKERIVSAACLDVHYSEPPDYYNSLLKYENVFLSPHIGANTVEAMERMKQRVKDILELKGFK